MKAAIYQGPHPLRVYNSPEEAPEGVLLFLFPEDDYPIPAFRVGKRLFPLEPDGVYRYFVRYEEPTHFKIPDATGNALAVFYEPHPTPTFGLEAWMDNRLVKREVIHTGPLAIEAVRYVLGGNHAQAGLRVE